MSSKIKANDTVIELSANVDDMTAEEIGFAFDMLFKVGALDVYALPAVMKKNRPGTVLNVLCTKKKKADIVYALFKYTGTIGIREKRMERYVLKRKTCIIDTPYGSVRVKKSVGYGIKKEKLEYDDLCNIAEKCCISIDRARKYIEKIRNKKRVSGGTL